MDMKTNNNVQYTSVTPTHSSGSTLWAIKAGFTHLKSPLLVRKVYRGGLVLWRGGYRARSKGQIILVSKAPLVLYCLSGAGKCVGRTHYIHHSHAMVQNK